MIKILVVEDERPISDLIYLNLTEAGYTCDCVYNGMDAANQVDKQNYDLILLDIMLPQVDGYELLEYIKPLQIPVIFITAKGSVEERVKGLKLGAEDYLTKPFAIIELLARVETVLRRYQKSQQILEVEDISIDTASRTVTKNQQPLALTIKEYELLLLFVRNQNIALFRDQIYERVWQSDYLGDSRTVDLHVQRLRRKLNWEHKIKAVYKIGYRLEA